MFCCALLCVPHLDGEERAGCLNLFVFLMSFDCYTSVALPHGAVGWSECVIVVFLDRSYSLAFHARIQNDFSEGVLNFDYVFSVFFLFVFFS